MKDNPECNGNKASDSQELKAESDNEYNFDAQIKNFLKRAEEAFKKVHMLSIEIHGSFPSAPNSDSTKDSDAVSESTEEFDLKHHPANTSGSLDNEEYEDNGDTAEYII